MSDILDEVDRRPPATVPGYNTKIIDGKHLNRTERRLEPLRHLNVSPLPGLLLAVLDADRRLVEDVFACEDGHAQERSLLSEVLETVEPNELWVAGVCEPCHHVCVLLGMDTSLLNNKFERMGARLKVVERPARRMRTSGLLSLDIGTDRRGEFFEITPQAGADPEVEVLDVQPADRHLLLLVRENGNKNKYLCGHDERHWFVAGIPESAPVGTVRQAKEALQPQEVQSAVARRKVSGKARNRRKNAAFVRQGEWFFLPVANMVVDASLVLTNEPLRRGRGKAHWADFCYRTGGETVYVCNRHPNGVTATEYKKILATNRNAKNWGWQTMRRNPGVYVRGRISHLDHATITLHGWHQVVMNTENQSRAMRNVAFLD